VHYTEYLLGCIEGKCPVGVLECPYVEGSSAQEFLSMVAEAAYIKESEVLFTERRNTKNFDRYVSVNEGKETRQCKPFESIVESHGKIQDVLKANQAKIAGRDEESDDESQDASEPSHDLPLVICIPNAECMDASVFEHLIQFMDRVNRSFDSGSADGNSCSNQFSDENSSKYLRVHFILVHSAICSFQLCTSRLVQACVQFNIVETMTPFDLYDAVIGKAFSENQVPVWLGAEAIAWIHENFWRSNQCVISALER
jgi:hypothetical protein